MDEQGLKGRLFGVSFLQRAATTRAKKPSKALDSTILRMHEVQVSLVCLASAAGREEIPHRNTPLLREQHKHSMDYGKEREGEEPGAKAHLCTSAPLPPAASEGPGPGLPSGRTSDSRPFLSSKAKKRLFPLSSASLRVAPRFPPLCV